MAGELIHLWDRALHDLIDRNSTVELAAVVSAPAGDQGEPVDLPRYKVRPLAYDPEQRILTTERARPRPGEPHAIHTHQRVDVYIITDAMRLVAGHDVREIAPYQLNDEKRITAFTLARVGSIQSAQRRSYFRVDTTACAFNEITLNRCGPTGRRLRPIRGRLINLSAGGVGLLVPMHHFQDEEDSENENTQPECHYSVTLDLPNNPSPVSAPVKLRRAHPDKRGDVYLGMALDFDPAIPEHQRTQAALLRLTTDLQREQLRRRRSA